MRKERTLSPRNGKQRALLSFFLAGLMLAVLFQTISASQDGQEASSEDLSNLGKTVHLAEAMSQDTRALNVYQDPELNFQLVVTGELTTGTSITNTAVISSGDLHSEGTVSTTIEADTTYTMYLPFMAFPAPTLNLALIAGPTVNNEWTIGYEPKSTDLVTGYEIQEAQNPSFTGAVLIQVNDPDIKSIERAKAPSAFNLYYYRARSKVGTLSGPWSNVILVSGHYRDDFGNAGTGWHTVRQDTDDTEQSSYYENGHYVHRQHGRWDYLISSPVRPAPDGAYRLEARMRFVGQDNLHTYGLVFGGDWDGRDCPNASQSSCFNHYYRLLAIWYGSSGKLRVQLKRIDRHDSDNVGRGSTLMDYRDVSVNSPPRGWQDWTIEVYPDGLIILKVNGNFIEDVRDTMYIDDPYFGAFSATNEYAGLQVELDWLEVSPLD